MGVNFYFASRKRGRVVDEWNWPGKDWNGMGYCSFTLARARIATFFNPRFGLVFSLLNVKAGMSAEDRDMLCHVDRFLPPMVCEFICQPDCEGVLTRRQCAAFVREVEGRDFHAKVAPCTVRWTQTWMRQPAVKTEDNAWMDHDEYVRSTDYLVGGIREAARRGCAFAWS